MNSTTPAATGTPRGVDVRIGDCLDLLPGIPDCSVDAIVTDPPYGLSGTDPKQVAAAVTAWVSGQRRYTPGGTGFMGARWDRFVPPPAVFDELLRVLKPGGHMACFAGARTQDLMGISARLAGFEIRDTVMWLYGSGVPKSVDLSKLVDKKLGADRPRHAGRAGGGFAHVNTANHGHRPGTYAAAGNRVIDPDPVTEQAARFAGYGTGIKPAYEPILLCRKPVEGTVTDTVLRYGTGGLNIDGCRIPHAGHDDLVESTGKNRHAAFGTRPGRNHVYGDTTMLTPVDYDGSKGRWPANVLLDEEAASTLDASVRTGNRLAASRFFYHAKASPSERPVAPDGTRHPTVKPLAVISWLVALLSPPPPAQLLDPFAGSGTTVEAAILAGHHVTAFEEDGRYLPLIRARVDRAVGVTAHTSR